MGLFRKKASTPPAPPDTTVAPTVEPVTAEPANPAFDELRAELASLRERLDASDRANGDLEAAVDVLNKRLLATAPPPAPPAPPAPPPPPAEPVELATAAQQADAEAAIERLHEHLGKLDERIEFLDTRVTSISTELANQLSEIGNDIEPMHESAERLAAEQARYQIQFRQDLAELAERFRRPGTT